jgi:integrase
MTEPTTQTEQKKYTYYRSTFYYNGKQYSATSSKSPREADRKADAKKSAMERAEIATGGNMTVEHWARQWLDTYLAPTVGEGHYKNCESYVKKINSALGGKRIKDVSPDDLQSLLNTEKGKSKSHVLHFQQVIQAVFMRARKSRHIITDPSEDLVLPTAVERKRRSITPEERAAILNLAETHRAGLWVRTILYCGLRPCETRALDWRHIDLENALIHVEQSMKARTKTIGAPKTDAGVRSIPIPLVLLDALREAQGASDEPVFKQPTTGRRHTETSTRGMWNNFARELDISMGAVLRRNKIVESRIAPDLVAYCLRHTYCTDLQAAGVPLNIAKYLMGHSDITVTANIYTHTTGETVTTAAKTINEYHS